MWTLRRVVYRLRQLLRCVSIWIAVGDCGKEANRISESAHSDKIPAWSRTEVPSGLIASHEDRHLLRNAENRPPNNREAPRTLAHTDGERGNGGRTVRSSRVSGGKTHSCDLRQRKQWRRWLCSCPQTARSRQTLDDGPACGSRGGKRRCRKNAQAVAGASGLYSWIAGGRRAS